MRSGPFLEMINGEIEVEVDGTVNWAKYAIDMPVSENENLACLVHYLWMMPRSLAAYVKTAVGSYGSVAMLSLWEPLSNADVVDGMKRQGVIHWIDDVYSVAVAGQACGWTTQKTNPIYFDPPILIAQRRLWFSAGQAGANDETIVAGFNIGFTVEKVSRDDFISALVRV